MGKEKRLELWWQLYRTSLPVRDLEYSRPMDFCWTECTTVVLLIFHSSTLDSEITFLFSFNLHSVFWTVFTSVRLSLHEYQPVLFRFTPTNITGITFFYSYIFCLSFFHFTFLSFWNFYVSSSVFCLLWVLFLTLIISSITAFDPSPLSLALNALLPTHFKF